MIKLQIKTLVDVVKVGFLVLVLGVSAGYVLADWTAPSFSAPTCPTSNPACNVPINVSGERQVKMGDLDVNTIGATNAGFRSNLWLGNGSPTNGVPILSANFYYYNDVDKPQPGYVLTAMDTLGKARWKPAPAAGGSSKRFVKGTVSSNVAGNAPCPASGIQQTLSASTGLSSVEFAYATIGTDSNLAGAYNHQHALVHVNGNDVTVSNGTLTIPVRCVGFQGSVLVNWFAYGV